MKSQEANQKYALAVVVGLLLIFSILPARGSQVVTHIPRLIVLTLTEPFVGLIYAATGTIGRTPDVAVNSDPTAEQLQKSVDDLNVENHQLRLLLGQKMRELQDLRQYYDHIAAMERPVPKRVLPSSIRISRVDDQFITLSKGSNARLRKGDVVVSGANLVGQIVECAPTYSVARLIGASELPIGARIVPPAVQRSQRGNTPVDLELEPVGEGQLRGPCKKNDPVAIGDIAIMRDPKWEAAWGYFIGIVTALEDDPSDPLNFQFVIVEPRRDLRHLRSVVVVASGMAE